VWRVFKGLLLTVLALCLGGAWWLHHPLAMTGPVLDLAVPTGASARAVARAAVQAGLDVSPELLYGWFRLSGQSRNIKAGNYELQSPLTPRSLLAALVRGDEAMRAVTLVEGLTFAQIRDILAKEEYLVDDSRELDAAAIMQRLGRAGQSAEGRFLPETYAYSKGSGELTLLARALRAMDQQLQAAWQERRADLPLKSPDDLLTLASIVEKETGRDSDRPMIAAVFVNRLRVGMPLQTDPTVIYGMGKAFDGNLRRRDLMTDTPWNTYTRSGLPPTPIAMPGVASLRAVAQPADSRALYFVARGDGSSQFSDSLEAHNRAVNQYQRGR